MAKLQFFTEFFTLYKLRSPEDSLEFDTEDEITMSCPHHSEQPILSWAAAFALELQELKGILPAAEGILNLCSCTQCSLAPVRNARATWS